MVVLEDKQSSDKRQHSVTAKTKRTLASVLPVSKARKGKCNHCSVCCKLVYVCPFLKYKPDESSSCQAYRLRPMNCRKYPRTKSEHCTTDTCGYRFE